MFKHTFVYFLMLFGCCRTLFAADLGGDLGAERIQDFVQKHLDLARIEREQFNVPISITLAQAILESGLGESRLAREANNFFGIKCHTWAGDTLLVKDDDTDQDGKLMESCFRSYGSAAESFRDHSVFLQKPRYQKFVADLAIDNYGAWANGLQSAGYATDKNYAVKLIQLIEAHNLAQYDAEIVANERFVGPPPPPAAPPRQRILMIQLRPEFLSFALR